MSQRIRTTPPHCTRSINPFWKDPISLPMGSPLTPQGGNFSIWIAVIDIQVFNESIYDTFRRFEMGNCKNRLMFSSLLRFRQEIAFRSLWSYMATTAFHIQCPHRQVESVPSCEIFIPARMSWSSLSSRKSGIFPIIPQQLGQGVIELLRPQMSKLACQMKWVHLWRGTACWLWC